WTLPWSRKVRTDVVRGVTRDKLIEERRSHIRGQVRYHAHPWIGEGRLHRRKAGAVGPQWHRVLLVPRVVDVTKAHSNFVAQVLVDLEQLLAPMGWESRWVVPFVEGASFVARSHIWQRNQGI